METEIVKRKPGRPKMEEKPIYVFDKMGKLLKEFKNREEAIKWKKITLSNISMAIREGRSIKGFHYSHDAGFKPRMSIEVFTYGTDEWVGYPSITAAAAAIRGCSMHTINMYLGKHGKLDPDAELPWSCQRYKFRRVQK